MLTLIGIDPGIVDTALTKIRLDFARRHWQVSSKVWSEVARRDNWKIEVNQDFLTSLYRHISEERALGDFVLVGIEGYRERGFNSFQDQSMLHLVQTINDLIPRSVIVDNTSIKKIVTNSTMKLFGMDRFPDGGNHADRKSAGRVALRLGISYPQINTLLSDFMVDNLLEGGRRWSTGSMSIL